mmetsp:Transcript_40830/g.100841  ORF Transcript_40830/g.100841 Transcript_40830/m.100841 type:complete len:451 (-) Transcript_40830:167-1519(-)
MLVRHQLEALAEHLAGALGVLRLQLLEQRVVDPQVDVAAPVALLAGGGHVGDGALVHVARLVHVPVVLLQPHVVEPHVVVGGVLAHVLLVLHAALAHHHVLDALAVPVLLLEQHEVLVHRCGLVLGQVVQRELVDAPRALELAGQLLELRKLHVQLVGVHLVLHGLHGVLVHLARAPHLAQPHLELGPAHPRLDRRVALRVAVVDAPHALPLLVARLHLHVRVPPVVVRLPVHPPLEDGARVGDLPHHLLHVDVLVPELVHAGQQADGAVPHVARVVHVLVRHLHLRVLQPQRAAAEVLVQRALPHRPRAGEVLLRLLPFGVLDPHRLVPEDAADLVLELLALLQAVLGQLLDVRDLLLGRLVVLLLPLLRLAHDLLRGDLGLRGGLILDARGARVLDGRGALLQLGAQGPLAEVLCHRHARHVCGVVLSLLPGSSPPSLPTALTQTGQA